MDNSISVDKNLELLSLENENKQNSFLESTFGRVIDFAVDTGIRALLPDSIENEIINIKDTMIEQGFSEGISEAIKTATELGKKAIGLITNNFESISQAESAFDKGGLVSGISNVLDFTLDKIEKLNIIPKNIIDSIKNGKDALLGNVSNDVKEEFTLEEKNIEKIEKYTNNWKEAYQNQDMDKMEKNISKIEKLMDKIMPIPNIIAEAKRIENVHELIKNNGGNFNITEEEYNLANLLA